MTDWLIGLLSFASLGAFLLLAEWFRRTMKWSGEITRKLTHVSVGLLVCIVAEFMASPLPALTLGVLFTVVDFLAIRFHWLKGIHDTGRATYGTSFYPLAFTLLVLFFWQHHKPVLILSMLVLSLADAGAAMAGRAHRKPRYYQLMSEPKTLLGSMIMGIITLLVIGVGLYYFQTGSTTPVKAGFLLVAALISAVLGAAVEALSWRGSDNLSVPLATAVSVYVFLYAPADIQNQYVVGFLLALGISVLSYRLRFLTASGSTAAFVIGTMVFGLGGWPFALPLLMFFLTSSLLSKVGGSRKRSFEHLFEKGSIRDAGQVLANGVIPAIVVVAAFFRQESIWYLMYVGTVAAITADTWGTEIGVLAGGQPRNIINLRRTTTGTSGSISLLGTAAGLLGAFGISAVGVVFLPGRKGGLLLALLTVAGLIGALMDSIMGATLQMQYECGTCGKTTERTVHCASLTTKVRGFSLINNNTVNLLCALSGGIAVWLLHLALES